jgi:hypothetical protein
MNKEKSLHGIIQISYKYNMDGEELYGYNEYDVEVIKYYNKTLPKEVKFTDLNNGIDTHYRYTKNYGWRKYNRLRRPKYQENKYIGQIINFIPNIKI